MNHKLQAAVAAIALAASAAATAQVGPIRPQYDFPGTPPDAAQGPGAFQLGGTPFYFAPFITLAYGRDDNLFLTQNNATKSDVIFVSPGFRVVGRSPNSVIQFAYQGNFGQYENSRNDDYVDHALRASFDFRATRELAARIAFDYNRGHDPRGSTDRPTANTPDEYTEQRPSVIAAFGTPGARGRVEGYWSDTRKRYENNRAFTRGSDRDVMEWGAAGYFRVMPRTQILAEYRKSDIDYTLITSPFSGEEERLFAGVTWEATAATTGTIKVGQLKKRFNSSLPSFSGTGWEAAISWLPRTYSKFDFYTYRQPSESSGLGSFILSEAFGVNWNHAWSSAWNTEVTGRLVKDKYQGFSRNDDTTHLGAKVGYKFRRWLQFGAEFQHSNRDSDRSGFDYDKNLWLLTATATL